jgi:hypothetical protein
MEAIEFYLEHPESMRRIAEAGHQFFRREYRLIDHVERMCSAMDTAWETARSGASVTPIRTDLVRSRAAG